MRTRSKRRTSTHTIYRPSEEDPIFGESHENMMAKYVAEQKRNIKDRGFREFINYDFIDGMATKTGYETCKELYDDINKYNLMKKFVAVSMNKNKLINFAFEYGLHTLFEYLYRYEQAMFDPKLISNYHNKMASDGSIGVTATSGLTNSTACQVDVLDIYTPGRLECIRYFQGMKKNSKYVNIRKTFFYMYNEN